MKLALRSYQVESIEGLRQGHREEHRRQLLCSPTGSGKTVTATFLMEEAAAKGTKSVFVVDRVSLVDQTSKTFDDYGIAHGVIQGSHWRARPWERTQILSAQTLARRGGDRLRDVRLLVWDEAHTQYKSVRDFILSRPDLAVVGLTATPFTKGLGQLFTNVVNVTTTDQLVGEGFLVPVKPFAAKPIDLAGVKVSSDGEWDEGELEKRGIQIVGDVVQGWVAKTQEFFGGPVKTILFSATVAHGEELCRQFQEAGYNFQQVSYKSNEQERASLIEEFRKPNSEIVGLVSVEALAKGFDVPDILCGVTCRPYRKSLSGHIQSMGRVMRPAPGKEFALWLDHAGNYLRFIDDTMEFFASGVSKLDERGLDDKARPATTTNEMDWACHQCKFIMRPADLCCPCCGWVRPRRKSDIVHTPGELIEVNASVKKQPDYLADKQSVWQQIVAYALEKKGGDAISAEKLALANYRNLYGQWPRYAMRNVEPMEPSPQLVGKLRSMAIAWHKRRAA